MEIANQNQSFIISRTPYRVSFLGGGTDYPEWLQNHDGAVLSTSINKYCCVLGRELPPFFEHKYNITYSEVERPSNVEDIKHPAIRECLKYTQVNEGLDIRHAGDLPARAGMGTSSSFTVGFLNFLYALQKKPVNNLHLAKEAIYIEQKMIKENVGSQDQVAASIGGFNKIDFYGDEIKATNIPNISNLESWLLLGFTGFSRTASKVVEDQIQNTERNTPVLEEIYQSVNEGYKLVLANDLYNFGKLVDYNWDLKKRLSNNVSTEYINFLYKKGINAGAIGGKLLGAGAGGFLLFVAEPDKHEHIKQSLSELLWVPFKFDNTGSQIIYKGNEAFNSIIEKPWGYESIISHNQDYVIWKLSIRFGEQTSFHAHPNKKTMMVVLKGKVKCQISKHTKIMSQFDSVVIGKNVFHSSEAISQQGAEVIEMDIPPLLMDIIRKEDKYGRAGKEYFPEIS